MSTSTTAVAAEDRFGTMQTVEVLRNEVKDLTEKLETLKGKLYVSFHLQNLTFFMYLI